MGALEKSVTVERSQRQEMTKSLQTVRAPALRRHSTPATALPPFLQWAQTQVGNVSDTLRADLAEREERLQGQLDALSGRIDGLAAQFEADKAEVLATVERENKALAAELAAFNAKFEEERADRLAREEALARRQAGIEQRTADALEAERGEREQAIMTLKARIQEAAARIAKADEAFQEAVAGELATLRNAVAAEEVAREREDDELLDTLQRYVKKLQASLQIINSSDTELRRM